MNPQDIIKVIDVAKGLNLSLCDVSRLINWAELSKLAKSTENKVDDVVVSTLQTILGVICKD